MNMRAGQYQQQGLKMAMKVELTQSIAILQYSKEELAAFLEDKMLENPFLSIKHAQHTMSPLGSDFRHPVNGQPKWESGDWMEQIHVEQISIVDYLLSQIHLTQLPDQRVEWLKLLILNLDDQGYLRISWEELNIPDLPYEEFQNALNILHGLEPYGIGARNLQECLYLQSLHYGDNPLAINILQNYFTPFAKKDWKRISKELKVSLQEIQCAADYIQTLNPRPADMFQQEHVSYIVPDVLVRICDGELIVSHVENSFMKINVNKQYLDQLRQRYSPELKQYCREKWQEYQWLSRAIKQRGETILSVMSCIVHKQKACFIHGLERLKPMTMKEIADELHVHESTVSRAVNGKFVQTPFGTYEIRIFFTGSLSSVVSQEEISDLKAKQCLTEIIANENKTNPLSDQKLVELLIKDHEMILARRTVAKYREQLGIPSSSKRKRYE